MKFNCKKVDLLEAVSIVQKAIKNNHTVNILDGILIQAEDKVKLTGYDLETGIESDLQSDVMEKGSVVVNSRLFGDYIKSLPDGLVTISCDDRYRVTIVTGDTKININGTSSETYPKIPVIDTNDKITISQKVLKNMIANTIFAVSKDDTRQSLTGCCMESNGSSLVMVAIDGFRMALRRTDMGSGFPVMNFIIPGKALSECAKIFDGDSDDKEVIVYPSSNHLLFDVGDVRIVSRLIQGPFVNYNSIIQKNPKSVMKIDRRKLLSAAERASIAIANDERRSPVRLSNTSNSSVLTVCATTEGTNTEDAIDISMQGENIDIDFNNKYLIDALKNIEEDNIKIEFNGSQGPCIILPEEGEQFLYLILPIRR